MMNLDLSKDQSKREFWEERALDCLWIMELHCSRSLALSEQISS